MLNRKRELAELINEAEPAWPLVQGWIGEATHAVEVLPAAPSAGASLVSMQLTTRSPLGAIIYESGGLLVDNGWLRILGSGHDRIPRSLPQWNFACGMQEAETPPPSILIADDVLGGFFALNAGRFGPGNTVWYFAPDMLDWEDTNKGYTDFIRWSFMGNLNLFYEPYRWVGWEADVATLSGDQAFTFYPPLWAEGRSIADRHRSVVALKEVFQFSVGTAQKAVQGETALPSAGQRLNVGKDH